MSKCLILAGGRGVRLKPITDTVPKTMVRVGGRPILEHTLLMLPKEISEVYIVIGWLGHQIKDHFGDRFRNRRIIYLQQSEPKGTFHALNLGKEFLRDAPFLVVSGDDLYSGSDLEKICEKESAVLTRKTKNPNSFGICLKDRRGYLQEIIEKPNEFVGNLANIGVYKLRPTIFDENIILGANGEQVLAPMIGNLAKTEKISLVQASFWHPIADIGDLNKAQNLKIYNSVSKVGTNRTC